MPIVARSPVLFPAFVAQHSVHFDERDESALSVQFPRVAIPESLRRAVRKRQVEFVAGRYCARVAISQCAPELADVPIGSGPAREPQWPEGIVGAITHTARYASVAVARTCDARAIGLDAEKWMELDVAQNIVDHLATSDEVDALARATGLPFSRALTLIFSAKETVYKCLFPEVQRYFDFRDASVECVDPARGLLAAKLLVTLTPVLSAGRSFDVRFEYDETLVWTGMVIPRAR